MRLASGCAVLVLGLVFTVSSRDNQQNEARRKIRVNSDLVVLSVSVKDEKGDLVSGLHAGDFQVLDDAVEQKVDVFSEEALPLSLVILIDKDLKWKEGSQMAKSLRAIVGGLSAQDEASVCRFDMLFYPGEDFTGDTGKLLAQLKDAQVEAMPAPQFIPEPLVCGNATTGPPCLAAPTYLGARPSKALDDAILSAAGLLEKRETDRRRLVLVISDAVNEHKLNHHSYEDVIEALLRENVAVFAVAVGSDSAKGKYSRLAGYAGESGGHIFYAAKSQAMERLYSRLTEEARHSYTLAYIPSGNNSLSNYHKVEIKMNRKGLKAETREGYYASRAEATPKN
jgi:VWFA-related protein